MSDEQADNIAQSLSNLGETTTAADLVRSQGQSKKVRVISEKKLMTWILTLLQQHMAGKQDAFSDAEKEELLKKAQDEIARRVKREGEVQAERDRMKAELDAAMAKVSQAQAGSAGEADLQAAIAVLKAKLEDAERVRDDLQQDKYELEDNLNEKMALLATTLAEKDRMRETVRNQMVRSTALIEGVLGLDGQYYANRHTDTMPIAEQADDTETFYHDFDVGAAVIKTLAGDLERLRKITQEKAAAADAAAAQPAQPALLERDLALLEQLKSGSLAAVDVAAPVAGLLEAVGGARAEAEALDEAVAEATGQAAPAPITDLPDGDSDPAAALAGTTAVVRELASAMAKARSRIAALKAMADEADSARNSSEDELDQARVALARVAASAAAKAGKPAPEPTAAVADLASSAQEALAALGGQVEVPVQPQKPGRTTAMLRKAGSELEGYVKQLHTELEQVRAERRALAAEVVRAAQGDDRLADRAADLAIALEQPEEDGGAADLGPQVRDAVGALAERKRERDSELAHAKAEGEALREELKAEVARRVHLEGEHKLAAAQLAEARAGAERGEGAAGRLRVEAESARQQAAEAAAARGRVEAERARLASDVDHAKRELDLVRAELARAKGEIETQRGRTQSYSRGHLDLAQQLVEAARGDDTLADAAADLALAVEAGGDSGAVDVPKLASDALGALAERRRQLAAELVAARSEAESMRKELAAKAEVLAEAERDRDEMAASGKEVIALLTQQKDSREKELVALRAENEAAAAKLAEFNARADQAETANRRLAEALARLAAAETGHGHVGAEAIEEPRVDLEVALSQLPAEGETGVEVPAVLAAQLAEAGQRLAEGLAAAHEAERRDLVKAADQQRATGAELEQSRREAAALRHQIEEAETQLRRRQAEADAVRQEMVEQGQALAQKVEELSTQRSHMVSLKADLSVATDRAHDLERRMAAAEEAGARSAQEVEALRTELEGVRARAESAEHLHLQVAQALRSLTTGEGGQTGSPTGVFRSLGQEGDLSDPVAKAAHKLELARAGGGEAMASASRSLAEAVRGRVQSLAAESGKARQELDESRRRLQETETELAGLRAGQLGREHDLANARTEVARLRQEQEALVADGEALRAEQARSAARLAEVEGQLRQSQAEIDEFHARGEASAGMIGDELAQTRRDLGERDRRLQEQAAQLAELAQRVEAGDVRLKRQREELTRRIEERDRELSERDARLEEAARHRLDHSAMQAQVQELNAQLARSEARIKELESKQGVQAGDAVRQGALAKDLQALQGERDRLRGDKRQLEADLADAAATADELRTQIDERRKELMTAREEMAREVQAERERAQGLKEEFRKLKEEVVGLRARLRRLTENKPS